MANNEDTATALIELDKQRFAAMVNADIDMLDRVIAADLTYVHTTAAIDTKESLLEGLASGRLDYESAVPSDYSARTYGDTAILRGNSDMLVNGNGFSLEFTIVYAKSEDGWQMAAWHATRKPS